MTISERQNAALILENTTVKPFTCCKFHFKCFYCEQKYPDVRSLLPHCKEHETPNKEILLKAFLVKGTKTVKVDISELNCRKCGETFTKMDDVRDHLTKQHAIEFTASGNGVITYNFSLNSRDFCCHICLDVFQTFILLDRHMNVHFSRAFCDTCGEGFMTYQRLRQHRESHNPGGFPCQKCGKVYSRSFSLKFHIRRVHQVKNLNYLKCPHCQERFGEHFRKMKHLQEVHGVTFSFECEVCQGKFPSRRALREHKNRDHSDKTTCTICNKSFGSVFGLKQHMEAHAGEKNYVCCVCQKAFRQEKTLKIHMSHHVHDFN